MWHSSDKKYSVIVDVNRRQDQFTKSSFSITKSTHSERMEMVFKNWNIWIAFREALDVSEKPRFDLQCELEAIKANPMSGGDKEQRVQSFDTKTFNPKKSVKSQVASRKVRKSNKKMKSKLSKLKSPDIFLRQSLAKVLVSAASYRGDKFLPPYLWLHSIPLTAVGGLCGIMSLVSEYFAFQAHVPSPLTHLTHVHVLDLRVPN